MLTCPSAVSSSSTLRGGRANLRNASVAFLLRCAKWQRSFPNADLSGGGVNYKGGGGGGRANLRNVSVTFSLFRHEASLG